MISCVLIALASTPVAFSVSAREADHIVVGTVVEVQHGETPSSIVEVEQALRGKSAEKLRVAAELGIGGRSLFLLKGERLLVELYIQKKYPGEFVFIPARVRFDGVLRSAVRELSYLSAVQVSAVLRSLKSEQDILALPSQARLVEMSCEPCELEEVVRRNLPAGAVDCGNVDDGGLDCVAAKWDRKRPIVVRAPWAGIDSDGTVALVGTSSGAIAYQLDSDVTGGGGLPCSKAVFANQCQKAQLGRALFGCEGKATVACSERVTMKERLGSPIPVESLDAGTIRFDSDGGAMICWRHLDGTLACH